jgi:hypothetical protein
LKDGVRRCKGHRWYGSVHVRAEPWSPHG